ncbi:Gfo/Idh/MocA family protein [Amycolatopsis suaedae]|uniref:Gfo/Idh/MocA family oxidoreductase n=1 Tax=Amycolatopsis suaedae TaxID=2510978 RepID=A0A4Q7JCD7_9PSEU|nr:Gfo/Idh/MocA family oxidoreductase [Amycolatopsis suaedae]RZQ65570.1 Gfo/Idh/MocA family oxidoreductase [Amycolatopsis suaedae]
MTVRLALVGLGDIGTGAHLPALRRNPDVEVVALADPDPARGAPYASLDEVLDHVAVDGVVLATPPWVTTDLITRATQAGVFVLAEKPVAVTPEAAAPLAELPPEQRARVQVGLTYRHDPAMDVLRRWITGRVLGDDLLVRAHIYDERRDPADPGHAGRIEATLGHGLPVVHEGAHVFDWFAHLFGGGPTAVDDAWSVATRPGLPSANLCGARLRYPGGVTVLAEFGWLTAALPRCEITFLGDRGHAVLDGSSFALDATFGHTVKRVRFTGDRTTRCFDLQVSRFVALITGTDPVPSPSLADGLAALETSTRVARLAGGGR